MLKRADKVFYKRLLLKVSKLSSTSLTPLCCAGETDRILNKWDNHNTIARGWAGVQANYHPVTFRKMYNVDNQKQTAAL